MTLHVPKFLSPTVIARGRRVYRESKVNSGWFQAFEAAEEAALIEARMAALARPINLWSYGETDLCELAAAYAEAIVRNHPFVDGNKRTGFMAADVFLARKGWELAAVTDETHADMMVALALGDIDRAQAAGHLRGHSVLGP